ncbi:disease resistance protein TAO1-like [Neltuma alba]|uniref:disease resistance protein TAO1-like n=1 Tax=Neltuma alba TaxID=207710 RepID=UPI0010A58E33|nr:disease resistance protein TAO1-like [Prosopis alba]
MADGRPTNIYLSHRDDDYNVYEFTDKLCAAFEAEGLTTFEQYQDLEIDDSLLDDLLKPIHESWVYIFIFSKNDATSKGHLMELQEITWRIHRPRGVIFIFYDLDLIQEKQVLDEFYDKVASQFSKFTSGTPDDLLEMYSIMIQPRRISKAINEIVSKVMIALRQLEYVVELVGMQSRVAEVEKLLNLSSVDEQLRVVGICGMGGIGKSTLAQVLYRSISRHFDAYCFIENISELLHDDLPLMEILYQNFEIKDPETWTRNQRRFLVVLDGVDHEQNLDALNLLLKSERFDKGSRIIITTRNERVLEKCEVEHVYRPKILSEDEALKFFCIKAFGRYSAESGYEEMTKSVLEYANGLPLAIIKLGTFLRQKSVGEWRSALAQLKRVPDRDIVEVLKRSFDELDDKSKEIFLDISCFFIGKKMDRVKEILDTCGFPAENGMKILIEKSLMNILDHKIEMHNMLQEMGQHIVRRGFPYEPKKWNRLWHIDDIDYVMQQNEGTAMKRFEAISLDLEDTRRVTLRVEALSQMSNLRLLIFRNVNFYGTLNSLSNELRYVSWHQYPFTSLPSTFEPYALVELIMTDSNIKELWQGQKVLPKLKTMILSGSKNLMKMPDFGGVPNLERLELEGCTGLLQLHASIARIPKLKFLNLRNCINLVSIPNVLFGQGCLEILNLAGCSKFASCLRFCPLKSSIEVRLLSIWYHQFLERMLYFFLFVLPQHKNYHLLVFCCLFYLFCRVKIKGVS